MMQYTGKYFSIKNSKCFDGENVNVLEYRDAKGMPHDTCCRCGRVLRKHWWTVQTADDDVEICSVGDECVKKLS